MHILRYALNTWMRETLKDDRLLKFLMKHETSGDMSDHYTSRFEDQVRQPILENIAPIYSY